MKNHTTVFKFFFLNCISDKDRLHNDIVDRMLSEHAYSPSSMDSATIIKHVAVITDTLWYLVGSMDKIQSRDTSSPTVDITKNSLKSWDKP